MQSELCGAFAATTGDMRYWHGRFVYSRQLSLIDYCFQSHYIVPDRGLTFEFRCVMFPSNSAFVLYVMYLFCALSFTKWMLFILGLLRSLFRQMSIDTERLVLSEVHVGSSTLDEEEMVSRYTYLTPPPRPNTNTGCSPAPAAQDARASSNADGSSSSEEEEEEGDSSSSGGESEEGSYSRVTRHRKRLRTSSSQRRRRPAHEVLTVVHRMATTLGLVGQQVWSAAFLLGDFVLTHEGIFAGMQVRCEHVVQISLTCCVFSFLYAPARLLDEVAAPVVLYQTGTQFLLFPSALPFFGGAARGTCRRYMCADESSN